MSDVILESFYGFEIALKGRENKDVLLLITVYDNLTDYPEKFVARLFVVKKAIVQSTEYIVIADTLEELADKIPDDKYFLGREHNDDPKIVGVYL